MSPQEANELEIFRRLKWEYDYRKQNADLRSEMERLERENAALRASEENLASTVRGLEFENEKLERENAALREVYKAAKLLIDYDHEGAEMGWPDWDDRFGWLKSAIDAARAKETKA